MENQSGDPEIDDDRAGVHDRSDQRSNYDRRVAVQFSQRVAEVLRSVWK